MTFEEYKKEMMKFTNPALSTEENTENAIYGMIGEFGEVCDLFKKHRYQGHPLDVEHLKKEMGDLMWYVALYINLCGRSENPYKAIAFCPSEEYFKFFVYEVVGCLYILVPHPDDDELDPHIAYQIMMYCKQLCSRPEINISFEDVLESNIAKLSARYPNGFNTEASINRREGDI